MAEERKEIDYLRLPEISEEDFCAYADREDFLRRYGNPVIIRGKNQRDLVCMAREYYERLMQDLGMFIEDENVKYWVYEFSMSWEMKLEFDRACTMCEMTPDEFVEAAVTDVLRRVETDPEGLKRDRKEIEEHPEQGLQMHLVRYYPVFKGDTEAQALKRILAEEAAQNENNE